jgi:hypothetical protein
VHRATSDMRERSAPSALAGVSDNERRIMERLLRMPHEQQKETSKPSNGRAQAQQRRRKKEKEAAATASHDA